PVGGDDLDPGLAVLSAAGADRFEGRQEAFEFPCTAPYLGGLSTAFTHSRPLLVGEQEECGIGLGGVVLAGQQGAQPPDDFVDPGVWPRDLPPPPQDCLACAHALPASRLGHGGPAS